MSVLPLKCRDLIIEERLYLTDYGYLKGHIYYCKWSIVKSSIL